MFLKDLLELLPHVSSGSKDIAISLGTASFKSVIIFQSCFKTSVNKSSSIISLSYSLKIPEEEVFLFILVNLKPFIFVLMFLMGSG